MMSTLRTAKDMVRAIPSTAAVVNQIADADIRELKKTIDNLTTVAKSVDQKFASLNETVDLAVFERFAQNINQSGLFDKVAKIEKRLDTSKAEAIAENVSDSKLFSLVSSLLSYLSRTCEFLSNLVSPVFWFLKLIFDKIVELIESTEIGSTIVSTLEMIPSILAIGFPVMVDMAKSFTIRISSEAWSWVLDIIASVSVFCSDKWESLDFSWFKSYFIAPTDTDEDEDGGLMLTLDESESDVETDDEEEKSDSVEEEEVTSKDCVAPNEETHGAARTRTMVPHAIAFAVSLVAGPLVNRKPDASIFDEALKRTNTLANVGNGLLDLTHWIVTNFQNCVTHTVASVMGWDKPSNRYFGILCSMMDKLSVQYEAEGRRCFTNYRWVSAVGFVGRAFDTYISKNHDNLTAADRISIDRIRRGRSKYYCQALSVAKTTRMEPLGVWMYGKAGIGKTLLSMSLLYWIFCGKYTIEDLVYVCNMNDQFSPNYNANPVYFLDDAGALDTPESTKQLGELLTICSSANYPLNQADLEDKGMPFLSLIVWATSNIKPHEITKGFTTPEAFWRRWNIICTQIVKAEYRDHVLDKYGRLMPLKAFDTKKFPEMEWLTIRVQDYHGKKHIGSQDYSVKDFITLVQKKLIEKRKATNLVTALNKTYAGTFCKEDTTAEFMDAPPIPTLDEVVEIVPLKESDRLFLAKKYNEDNNVATEPNVALSTDPDVLDSVVSQGAEVDSEDDEKKHDTNLILPHPGLYKGHCSVAFYKVSYSLEVKSDMTFELTLNIDAKTSKYTGSLKLDKDSDIDITIDQKLDMVELKSMIYRDKEITIVMAIKLCGLSYSLPVTLTRQNVEIPSAVHAVHTQHLELVKAMYHASKEVDTSDGSVYDLKDLFVFERKLEGGGHEHGVWVKEGFDFELLAQTTGCSRGCNLEALARSYETGYQFGVEDFNDSAYVAVFNPNFSNQFDKELNVFGAPSEFALKREKLVALAAIYVKDAEREAFVDSAFFYAIAMGAALKTKEYKTWDEVLDTNPIAVGNYSSAALKRERKVVQNKFINLMCGKVWTKDVHEEVERRKASTWKEKVLKFKEDNGETIAKVGKAIGLVVAVGLVGLTAKKMYNAVSRWRSGGKPDVKPKSQANLFDDLQKKVAENSSEGAYSAKVMRKRKPKKQRSNVLKGNKSRGKTLPEFRDTPQVQKISANTAVIELNGVHVTGVFVKEKYFMTNLHVFLQKNSRELLPDGTKGLLIGKTARYFTLKRENIHIEEMVVGGVRVQSEVVIYDFSSENRMDNHKSIVGLFMDYERFRRIRLEDSYLLHRQLSPTVKVEDVGKAAVSHRVQRFASNNGKIKGENAFATAIVNYIPDFGKGSCGSVVMTSRHPQIYGLHFGYSTSLKMSNSAAITRERLESMLAAMSPNMIVNDSRGAVNLGEHLEYYGPSRYDVNDYQCGNDLQRSLLADQPIVAQDKTMPTKVSNREFRRAGLNPIEEDRKELDKFKPALDNYDEKVLAEVESEVVRFVCDGATDRKEYTDEEAINGKGRLRRLSMNTSSGIPWKSHAEGKGKKAYLEFDEPSQKWQYTKGKGEKLAKAVENLECIMAEEEYEPYNKEVVSEYSRKAEARKEEKGTRSINTYPLHFLILFRKKMGALMEHFQAMFHSKKMSFSTLGINPLGDDWNDLMDRLSKFDYWLDGDIRKFEGLIGKRAVEGFKKLCRAFYKDDPEREHRIRDRLIDNCMKVLLHYDGHWYKKVSGLSSGAPPTSILNTFWNCIMLGYCWLRITRSTGAPAHMQTAQFYVWDLPKVFNGDDHIINVPAEALGFNLLSVKGEFEKLGGGYTPAEKGKECTDQLKTDLSEVLYLKNYSTYHTGQWHSWAEHESLIKSLKWVSGKMDVVEATVVNLANALLRLTPSGRERFDQYRDMCVEHLESKGIGGLLGTVWTYDTTSRLICATTNVDILELIDEVYPDDVEFEPIAPECRESVTIDLRAKAR